MNEHLNDFMNWMEAMPALWAYVAIFVIAYGENVAPPIPGDMVVVFGGYLVGIGKLSFVAVVALSTAAGVLGFMTMYAIGYKIGDAVMDPERLKWIPKDQVAKAERWLDRWGYGLVAANRFLSGLRSVISLTVGMVHMPPLRTALYATLSAAAWTVLITYGGFAVGENWERIAVILRDYGRVILGLVILVAVMQVVRWYLKRKGSGAAADDSGNISPDGG